MTLFQAWFMAGAVLIVGVLALAWMLCKSTARSDALIEREQR